MTKKKRCAVCSGTKARRKCEKYDQEFICPKCCGEKRGPECEGCRYFMAANQYQSHKARKVKKRHFTFELHEEAENQVNEALDMIEDGKIDKGESILNELKVRYPRYYKVDYGIGVIHAFKGELDEAIACFERAVDVFPYFLEAHFNLGVAYTKKLDVRNAIKSYREVMEIGDSQNDLVRQAGEFVSGIESSIMESSGIPLERYFSAQDEFEKAFSFMEKAEWHKAIQGFEKCIRLNPKHPQSYGNLGLCYAKTGRRSEAIAAFEKALEFDPDYEPAMVHKALVNSLPEGDKLDNVRLESIDYYQDFPMKKKSYIQTFLKDSLHR